VTTGWSVVSGAGGVTFGDASSPDTTATFAAPGSYVLQLLADDSELSASDTVSILVQQIFALSVSSVGPGSVTLDPPGGSYADGTPVTVTATPEPDAAFVGWSGDLSGGASPETLLVDADKSISASFATLYDVGTSVAGPGSVTLDPPGGTYPAGTVVSVSATPGAGAAFLGFGGDLAGTDNPQLLTVDADKSVSASFVQHHMLDVTVSGSGSVTLDPAGGSYPAGTSVTLTAVPTAGWYFSTWGGDATGTASPLELVIEADVAIDAQFKSAGGGGTSCGIGPELVALLPPLGWLLRRRRKLRIREPART
jgi:hypothetical protein